jgi:hypothetical protein
MYKERVNIELTNRCPQKADKWFDIDYDTWNPKKSRGQQEALKIEHL